MNAETMKTKAKWAEMGYRALGRGAKMKLGFLPECFEMWDASQVEKIENDDAAAIDARMEDYPS